MKRLCMNATNLAFSKKLNLIYLQSKYLSQPNPFMRGLQNQHLLSCVFVGCIRGLHLVFSQLKVQMTETTIPFGVYRSDFAEKQQIFHSHQLFDLITFLNHPRFLNTHPPSFKSNFRGAAGPPPGACGREASQELHSIYLYYISVIAHCKCRVRGDEVLAPGTCRQPVRSVLSCASSISPTTTLQLLWMR